MANNDLLQPLQRKPPMPRRSGRPVLATALISAALLLFLAAAGWVAVVDDPDGGRAVAVASIEGPSPSTTGSVGVPALPAALDAAIAPSVSQGADPGLLEYAAAGPLPRVAPDGRRPRESYSRRVPATPPDVPRIVLVVGGLGISQTGTQAAIELLPEDVTLAFAPYGSSLQRWVAKAREEGHEVLLQVPLEPDGYPQENPGEHTLLTGSHNNRESLHWVLSRMTAYAGVMNYMGARFTGDEQALVPFLGEIGERGLFYLDDGSSPQSRVEIVGHALRVPVLTADSIVDRLRTAADIERELAALEIIARTRGFAVGVASAFPVSVEAVARWAEQATARGIAVVPASAALAF